MCPLLEVGEQLNLVDLLGGNLLRFTNSSQSVPSILNAGTGFGPFNKGSPNAQRIDEENVDDEVCTASLKDKYVMICCVFVPCLRPSEGLEEVYHTALASHELARRDDFVLVVVPMMKEGFAHSSPAYRDFFSGFSCLAVPFHDSRRREYIRSALGFNGKPQALILDPSHKVLYHGQLYMFTRVGGAMGDCFPFTSERVEAYMRRESSRLEYSLNELLGLEDTDVLCHIESLPGGGLKEEGGGRRTTTISELKRKVVGVYMWSGMRLSMLEEVYKECKRKEYELEIVVVSYPFERMAHPSSFEKSLIDALARNATLKGGGCWFLPFNNSVCHRLWLMSCRDTSGMESLLIVDPSKKHVDPYGSPIFADFGIDVYPFTRRKVIEDELQRKMGLRLESLLLPWTHVHRRKAQGCVGEVPVADVLKNKIVILYLNDQYEDWWSGFGHELGGWYKDRIKGKRSDVEVVVVNTDGVDHYDDYSMKMGWLVCPPDPAKSAKLCREYFRPSCRSCEVLVAFGKDGRILSLDDESQILEFEGPPIFYANNERKEEMIARELVLGGLHYMGNAARHLA